MQLREFVGFHSGINNVSFLLLHETTLLGKWLQTFRQTGSHFKKDKVKKTIPPVEDITSIFLRKVRENITE